MGVHNVKTILTSIAASSLLTTLAIAQPRYTVTDLGTLPGGTFSQATFVNNNPRNGGCCFAWAEK